MSTAHNSASKEQIAKSVLMPGDPLRAKFIAETFLENPVLVNPVRGVNGYTGTYKGVPVTVMASGMGMPSIGIYSHELFSAYGVEAIIRVGTCGTYQPEIKLEDVLICTTASTDSNWMSQFKLNGTYSAGADFELALTAYEEAKKAKIPYHAGNVLAADIFYDPDPETWKRWAQLGVLGVEMESYSLYVNAARLHKKALCLLTVTDSFINRDQRLTSEERAFGLGRMIELAISVAERYA